jgi:sugar lactone lactonase YvrE
MPSNLSLRRAKKVIWVIRISDVDMSMKPQITSVTPPHAIPGGEVILSCEGLRPHGDFGFRCSIGGIEARLVGASQTRLVALVPDGIRTEVAGVVIEGADGASEPFVMRIGATLVDSMHIVANPAVDPSDGSVIVTVSGTRGQKLPRTLFRVSDSGRVDEIPAEVLNPTAVAFDSHGKMFVSCRAQGWVCEVGADGDVSVRGENLGIATGLAFDNQDSLFVGDRSGTIYRLSENGDATPFATLEASVAAYHIAFGPGGRLFVTAPGLASFDSVHSVDEFGFVSKYFRGLGRPQGLAFDSDGNLYVAASYRGRRGIIKIAEGATHAEVFISGGNVVGTCFGMNGQMYVATSTSLYSFDLGLKGILLN